MANISNILFSVYPFLVGKVRCQQTFTLQQDLIWLEDKAGARCWKPFPALILHRPCRPYVMGERAITSSIILAGYSPGKTEKHLASSAISWVFHPVSWVAQAKPPNPLRISGIRRVEGSKVAQRQLMRAWQAASAASASASAASALPSRWFGPQQLQEAGRRMWVWVKTKPPGIGPQV